MDALTLVFLLVECATAERQSISWAVASSLSLPRFLFFLLLLLLILLGVVAKWLQQKDVIYGYGAFENCY